MLELLGIFILALFSLWMAAIAGMALGLEPLMLVAILTVGYACSVTLIVIVGAPVRKWALRKLAHKLNPDGAIGRVMMRYGVVGLGLLAPVVTGAPVGTALGLTLSVPPRRLWIWMTAGAALWSITLTIAALLGVVGMHAGA
jgi:hypothetical protein